MTIKKLKKETTTKEALDYLKKKHYHYFIPKVIDEQQMESTPPHRQNWSINWRTDCWEKTTQAWKESMKKMTSISTMMMILKCDRQLV